VTQIKEIVRKEYALCELHSKPTLNCFLFKKNSIDPIISTEHFIDIDSLIGNNNKAGVGIKNCEKKTCGHKDNIVINSSLPGGTWL
jgi:hypothetical protein